MAKMTKTVAVLTLTACSLGLTSVASAQYNEEPKDKDKLECKVKHFNKFIFFDRYERLKEIILEVPAGKVIDVEEVLKKHHFNKIFDVEYSAVCVFDGKKEKGRK